MRFKLIFKQACYDFYQKIGLYITFTLFLILSISLSVGLITFAISFDSVIQNTVGTRPFNSFLNLNYRVLPAWVAQRDDYQQLKKMSGFNDFEVLENQENQPLTRMLNEILEEIDSSWLAQTQVVQTRLPILNNEKIALILGYLVSADWELTGRDLAANGFLNFLICDGGSDNELRNQVIENYNRFIRPSLALKLMDRYYTTYFLSAYLANQFHLNPQKWQWSPPTPNRHPLIWASKLPAKALEPVGQKGTWSYLRIHQGMIKDQNKDFFEDTPWLLKASKNNPSKIWKQINWQAEEYQTYLANFNFVYVPMNFFHQNNLTLGQTLTLFFPTQSPMSDQEYQGASFLLAGVVSDPDNFYQGSHPIQFSIPYQWMKKVHQPPPSTSADAEPFLQAPWDLYQFNQGWQITQFGRDFAKAQTTVGNALNATVCSLVNPGFPLAMSTDWIKTIKSPGFDFAFSKTIFLILSWIVGILVLALLVLVFYFLTKEIIFMQRQTLYFLKAMGVYNSGLSTLTTWSLLFPIFSGIIGSFFGSLAIQQMMNEIVYENTSLFFPYFSGFSGSFFLVLLITVIVAWGLFYLINVIFIKSKTLTLHGLNPTKSLSLLGRKLKLKLSTHLPSKLQIGISFAFKNFYKNVVTFFVLLLAFTIILYSVQFKASLSILSGLYEKWNQPYQGVNLVDGLDVFALDQATDQPESPYLESYQVITDEKELQPIRNLDEFQAAIQAYAQAVKDLDPHFSWTNYYLAKEWTKILLPEADNPIFVQNVIEFVLQELKDAGISSEINVQEVYLLIADSLTQMSKSYRQLQQEFNYNDGINIFLGKALMPKNIAQRRVFHTRANLPTSRSLFNLIGYEDQNEADARHFGFINAGNYQDFLTKVDLGKGDADSNFFGEVLKVNISAYLNSVFHLERGEIFQLQVPNLRSAMEEMTTLYLRVENILKEDTVKPTIYTNQKALFYYLQEQAEFQQLQPAKHPGVLKDYQAQAKAYGQLVANDQTKSNSVYDLSNVPWGLINLTLPLYQQTFTQGEPGSRLEDFYSNQLDTFLQKIGDGLIIFAKVTEITQTKAAPFITTLNRFIVIFSLLALIVSAILIIIILFENQQIILLFKAMGYKRSEVNWYLISGYFLAAILAIIVAIGASLGILNGTKGTIAEFIGTTVYFVWSWQFILLAFSLGIIFCLLISVSIIIFTNRQQPRNAFVVL